MDQLERGIPPVLRGDPGVRGAALDLDTVGIRALAPHGERVREITGLEVQLDVGILEESGDEGSRSGRATLLRGLHEKDDLAEIREAESAQNLERIDTFDHTALLI